VFGAIGYGLAVIIFSKIPEDHTSRFLEYYGQYLTAKRQKEPHMIRLSAVGCRKELQKMGDLAKEAKYCQKIFEPFVGKKQAEQIYRDLCDDSRSYPIKTIDLPGCSLEGSLFDEGNIPTSPVQRSAALDRGIYFPKEQFPNKKAERFWRDLRRARKSRKSLIFLPFREKRSAKSF